MPFYGSSGRGSYWPIYCIGTGPVIIFFSIPGRYPCKTDRRDVYVPFALLKSYYETAGEWAPGREGREFDISLSYSKVRGTNPKG